MGKESIKIILSGINTLKIKGNIHHISFDIGFTKLEQIKLWSGATSLFDVQRWTFDVGCSSFKP
jgi:hypothetical protein